jgi:CheY-like chemotaxis protein
MSTARRHPAKLARPGATGAAGPVEEPARVLIADDGAGNRLLLARLLQPDGYRISLAADGAQALAAALQDPPDLLLLDVLMPEMDGFEVCRLLKERPETADVPVVFLTALDESADKLRGLLLGAVDWVAKPFDPAEVRARVLQRLDAEYPFERFERHATLACLQLDAHDGTLRGSLAGHPQPLVLRADGTLERLSAGGPLLGLGGPFGEDLLQLRAGDRLFLHTDGVVELEGPDGATFGEARLEAFLADRRDEPLQATCDALLAELRDFAAGRPARDDLTFLALHFHGPLGPHPGTSR